MNLTEFLTRVDESVKQMSREELENFLHLRARTLPEKKRDEFIEQLLYVQDKLRDSTDEYSIDSIKAELSAIMEELQKIETGEIGIGSRYNEEYDDWYCDISEEFIFEDTKEIGNIIDRACALLHTAVKSGLFSDARALSEKMMSLIVEIYGDYENYSGEPMSLVRLYHDDILSFDFTGWGLDTLYSVYITEDIRNRPKSLYKLFMYFNNANLSIERLMQSGYNDLPEIDEFLTEWIQYLGTKKEAYAQTLIKEASGLLNNGGNRLAIAQKYCAEHPGLYEQLLTDRTGFSTAELLKIGEEALESIPENLVIRSRIALLTAEYALELNKPQIAEECWIEAYRSDTNPINFLRIAVNSKAYESRITELRSIYDRFSDKRVYKYSFARNDELYENIIDDNTYYTLMFFGGEFRRMVESGMNTDYGLGWSSTFMKCGIALLLIYLFNGNELPSGCEAMCSLAMDYIGFDKGKYLQGIADEAKDTEGKELFLDCFEKWKKDTPMEMTDREYILKKLDSWVSIRVEGIMKENRRRYYNECAAYIAALGEVNESLGITNGKALLMELYRKKYSRRSAFRAELRRFGMID